MFDIDFNIFFQIEFWIFSSVSILSVLGYLVTHPVKLEKLIALISKSLIFLHEKFDYSYVKYDLQGRVNGYLEKVAKRVSHIEINQISINWIDPEKDTEEEYINNGQLIIRLKKSDNQNENIVKASMAFISHSFLRKAKSYIAKYQRESMDLFACYDLLKEEKAEILDQFVQDFLKDKLDSSKIASFFDKYVDIDEAGIFYPVLAQELTFLGQKVYARKKDREAIHKEVTGLVRFLHRYANRKVGDEDINDYEGTYCSFAIRIIGRSVVINDQGARVYINHLKKIAPNNETIYLIGNAEHKEFMKNVYHECKEEIDYKLLGDETYDAIIKDAEGENMHVKNYMMTLRSNEIKVYHGK